MTGRASRASTFLKNWEVFPQVCLQRAGPAAGVMVDLGPVGSSVSSRALQSWMRRGAEGLQSRPLRPEASRTCRCFPLTV